MQVWPEDRSQHRNGGFRAAGKVVRHTVYVIAVLIVGAIAIFAIGDFLWHQVVTAPHPAPCRTVTGNPPTC